jgi:nicotinamide mononucleotide transporter
MWLRVIDDDQNRIGITRSSKLDYIKSLLIFMFSSLFVLYVYVKFDVIDSSMDFSTTIKFVWSHLISGSASQFRAITPYVDTFTTGAAFAAMWMMANKKLENWVLWIIVNIVSIPLYFIKGFGFTGIQYFIFLVLAIFGYLSWIKNLKTQNV